MAPTEIRFNTFRHTQPFQLHYNNATLPRLDIAYETWGELNSDRSNAVLVFHAFSGSSHAHSSPQNARPGWWEEFINHGSIIDIDKHFVICANYIGSCFGSTGPSSIDVTTGKAYATTFPILSVNDLVKVQFLLLDHLEIEKLYACIGASIGGMCSLLAGALFPGRVGRLISISACRCSSPTSIANSYAQRKAVMLDPNWKDGFYYGEKLPLDGMQLAREIATLTYRSNLEWEKRFGRKMIQGVPIGLSSTFQVEQYLDHQGRRSAAVLDANTLLYLSKAMDLFELSKEELALIKAPTLIIGITTDTLFPVWQQSELAHDLLENGTPTTYFEMPSIYGHDTFLIDKFGVGAAVKGFLETKPIVQPQRNTLFRQNY